MQLKPIAAITVLLLVITSMSVCGCTTLPGTDSGSSGTVSTDYPTSGRSKLVEGAADYLHSQYNIGWQNEKQKAFDVNWISNTKARIHEEFIDTQKYVTYNNDYTITHFPSTAEATTYLRNSGLTNDASSSTLTGPIIDYYKITGKTPTVHKVYQEDWTSLKSISQFDSLIVEYTWTKTD